MRVVAVCDWPGQFFCVHGPALTGGARCAKIQMREGMTREKRNVMVEPHLATLPLETQRDIVTLFTFAPSELQRAPATFRAYMLNTEFDDPSPSTL
jgi:hypothetical protein